MEGQATRKPLTQRIRTGDIRRQDVVRRMAELAFGKANDCVRLVLENGVDLDRLDLSLLSEVRRSDKGTVEVKLLDRLRVLEQLAQEVGNEGADVEGFLRALQDGAQG